MKENKTVRAIDVYNTVIDLTARQTKIPWEVKHQFRDLTLSVIGDQISFGEDFVSLEEARRGLEFLVNELGGKIKWEK